MVCRVCTSDSFRQRCCYMVMFVPPLCCQSQLTRRSFSPCSPHTPDPTFSVPPGRPYNKTGIDVLNVLHVHNRVSSHCLSLGPSEAVEVPVIGHRSIRRVADCRRWRRRRRRCIRQRWKGWGLIEELVSSKSIHQALISSAGRRDGHHRSRWQRRLRNRPLTVVCSFRHLGGPVASSLCATGCLYDVRESIPIVHVAIGRTCSVAHARAMLLRIMIEICIPKPLRGVL